MDRLHVATLNIRNLADRWDERLPLLLADMAALQPDLFGLQEVVYVLQQDRLIGAAGEGRYEAHRGAGPVGRSTATACSSVSRCVATGVARLDLGLRAVRAARRRRPARRRATCSIVVTHLHHEVDGEAARDDQARDCSSGWTRRPRTDAQVVMGDFNAEPASRRTSGWSAAGYRSAHAEANGGGARVTWPSGLQAPGMDTDGDPGCLDYVWVRGAVRVDERARWCSTDRRSATRRSIPSDHLGISARLEIGGAARG